MFDGHFVPFHHLLLVFVNADHSIYQDCYMLKIPIVSLEDCVMHNCLAKISYHDDWFDDHFVHFHYLQFDFVNADSSILLSIGMSLYVIQENEVFVGIIIGPILG